MASVSILVAGHINWDVTLRVDRLPEPDGEASIRSQHQSGGGSAANVAAALAGLGVEAGLIGSVGDDDHGLLARRELEAAGVSLSGVRVIENAETAVKYLLVDENGEVAILGNNAINEAITPDDLEPARIRAVDHVHLTGQRPDTAAAIARVASDAGTSVSFDPGRRLADRDYGDALALADLVFVTDREATALRDSESTAAMADNRIMVVTCGADGAKAYTPEGTLVHSGFDVEPVDTAGAGDAFAAGFLSAWLTEGAVDRALAYGNACGSLTASRDGARSAPTASTVEDVLVD